MSDRDYEAEAAKDGWAPQDQWKGDPDKWKSAEQFVKDGENINGILKSKVDRLDQRVSELLESNKKLNEMSQRQIKKEKAETARLISELESVKAQAITDGDGAAAVKAERDINELRESSKEDPSEQMDPLAATWLTNNEWYSTNEKLAAFADGIAERVARRGFTGQAYYDELTRQVKETFPDEFGNKNRSRSNGVETDGKVATDSKAKTYDNLPAEAKKACAEFIRDIPGFTKEQYVASYEWE